jgi:hypothetical protein
MKQTMFSRTAFTTDRMMEFFSESEFTTQFGYGKSLWPLALAKELIDNSLDTCEITDVAPEIVVILEPDAFTVGNNGPGLTPEIVDHSLDYHVRIGVIGKEHIERLRAFRQQLLRQYHVESLNELPPGPLAGFSEISRATWHQP